jgi:hypothetical protein
MRAHAAAIATRSCCAPQRPLFVRQPQRRLPAIRSSASAAAASQRSRREPGQHLLAIELDDFGLVGLRGLHKDMGDAAINQLLQRRDVHLRVFTDYPRTVGLL